jgi:hypothetical protein
LTKPIFVDTDGERAANAAADHESNTGERAAVWIGTPEDPELAEMRAELEKRA